MKYVYCSGPLFCPEEIGGMTAISNILEDHGYGTFLPHRDGLEAHVMKHINSPVNMNLFKISHLIDRAIFALDVYQVVERCEYFVFNMNGRVPDEGGVAETAMAYTAGKPIVIYKNDYRTTFKGKDNSMVTGLASSFMASNIKEIPNELKKAAERMNRFGQSPYNGENIPPVMKDTLKLGKNIWKVLKTLKIKSSQKEMSSELINEIADICKNHPDLRNPEKKEI